MSIFDRFDAIVDTTKIREQIKEAVENSYEDVPAGKYIAKVESMELGLTKKDNRPMFKVQMRLVEGCGDTEGKFLSKYKNKKPCIFMNRVIFGTKNDPSMIASVEGWLAKIGFENPPVFVGYSDFAQVILDCAEQCEGIEMEVEYNPDNFNTISINEVYES